MRTTLEIDPKLVAEAVKLTGEKNKGRAVSKALEEYIRRKKIEELRVSLGKLNLDDTWYELRHMEPR